MRRALPITADLRMDPGVPCQALAHRTGGLQRTQPVFCMWAQASRALCRSMRLLVCGTGGRGGSQLKVRSSTQRECADAAVARNWVSSCCCSL